MLKLCGKTWSVLYYSRYLPAKILGFSGGYAAMPL
jgi:hypothetical protein